MNSSEQRTRMTCINLLHEYVREKSENSNMNIIYLENTENMGFFTF